MADFEELVENKLKSLKRNDMVEMWKEIYQAYDSGGPDSVESLLLDRLDQLKRSVNKESREMMEAIPLKRKRRK